MTKPSLLELPPGVQLVYLAEGGANVIYRFIPSNSNLAVNNDTKHSLSSSTWDRDRDRCDYEIPASFRGKLLRLRKETVSDVSYREIIHNFNAEIRPLFQPHELIDQTLIRLPDYLVPQCNEQLRISERNGSRPTKRHGGYLCVSEPFGLFITDMTVFNEPGATLAELKPKWLLQSPSAPVASERCRTCALREMKNDQSRRMGMKEQRSFCPLDLVSEQFKNVLRATDYIKGCDDRARLARILFRNSTLRNLQSRQKTCREVGLLGPSALSRETSLDMTLRDCTMFIKIPHDESSPVEIRLGDLDLKTGAGGKAQYWRDLEHQLIDGGWYTGSNDCQESSECALARFREIRSNNGC